MKSPRHLPSRIFYAYGSSRAVVPLTVGSRQARRHRTHLRGSTLSSAGLRDREFLAVLWRVVRPDLWSGAKTLRRETLRTEGDILTDNVRSTDEDPRYIVSRRLNEMAQNLIGKLRGRGRKRKAGVAKRKQKGGKKPRLKRQISSPKRQHSDCRRQPCLCL